MDADTAQPPSANPVAGIVIAGGRSLRFGSEKAVALLAGKSLLMWAVERLQRSCCAVAVNARPGTAAEALARAQGLVVLHDAMGDAAGPLAGVKVGLEWATELGASALAVSPCDVPLLPQEVFDRLIQSAGAAPAMAATRDGHQPLCAVWPVSALPAVRAALAGGQHPATWRLLEQLGAQRVHFEPAGAFANINTQIDLAAMTHRIEQEAVERARRS